MNQPSSENPPTDGVIRAQTAPMTRSAPSASGKSGRIGAERLFPFALRARILILGREQLQRRRKQLQFVLLSTDLTERGSSELRWVFRSIPLVQCYSSADLELHFGLRGVKVIGFRRSHLAASLLRELNAFRIQTSSEGSPRSERGTVARQKNPR